MWRVQCKCFVIRIPSGRCLKSSNVTAVPEFRLSVTANVFVVGGGLQEFLVLLLVALVSKCDQKHAFMKPIRPRL